MKRTKFKVSIPLYDSPPISFETLLQWMDNHLFAMVRPNEAILNRLRKGEIDLCFTVPENPYEWTIVKTT